MTEPLDHAARSRASARRTAWTLGAIVFGIWFAFVMSGVIGR